MLRHCINMAVNVLYIRTLIVLFLALVSSGEARRARRFEFPRIGDLSKYQDQLPVSNGTCYKIIYSAPKFK